MRLLICVTVISNIIAWFLLIAAWSKIYKIVEEMQEVQSNDRAD